jgi:hypothetical protein
MRQDATFPTTPAAVLNDNQLREIALESRTFGCETRRKLICGFACDLQIGTPCGYGPSHMTLGAPSARVRYAGGIPLMVMAIRLTR